LRRENAEAWLFEIESEFYATRFFYLAPPSSDTAQKARDNLDLVRRDQGRRMAAILHSVRRRIAVSFEPVI
jgi:hypothetical protein